MGQKETNRPLSENNSGAIDGRCRTDVHGTEHISRYHSLVPHGGRTSVFRGIEEGGLCHVGVLIRVRNVAASSVLESTSASQTTQTRGWRHGAKRAPRETESYLLP